MTARAAPLPSVRHPKIPGRDAGCRVTRQHPSCLVAVQPNPDRSQIRPHRRARLRLQAYLQGCVCVCVCVCVFVWCVCVCARACLLVQKHERVDDLSSTAVIGREPSSMSRLSWSPFRVSYPSRPIRVDYPARQWRRACWGWRRWAPWPATPSSTSPASVAPPFPPHNRARVRRRGSASRGRRPG